ncbi:trichohyalin-like [Sander lucioperca]|uniref:trichohyalin-like n=1 Tax=Sander lucioperca TaxID=283035 RepID=UPI00125CD777|nr:trichohyalin-like [Sander lucioperca]
MATAKVTILSKAQWVRLPSVFNQPKETEVYNMQAEVETHTPTSNVSEEDKPLLAWQNMQEENQADQRARGRRFNSVVFRKCLDNENKLLIELKRRKEKMAKDEDRKNEEMMQSKREKALRLEQEKSLQKKLQNCTTAKNLIQQIKKRELLKEEERLQEGKYAEFLRSLDERHAQELRQEAEKKAELKKSNLQNQLENMSRRNLNIKREAQTLWTEEQKAKQDQLEMERKLLQRKTKGVQSFRNIQTPKQIVSENLMALQEEKAATMALTEEQMLAKDLADREADLAKQQKEEEEKRAAMFQSIAAHRQNKIREKEQNEKAEHQSDADWIQAQMEADRLFLLKEKVKAQKIREDKIKLHNFNVAVAAEKRALLEELKREKRVAAKNAEQFAVKEKQQRQYIENELLDAAENRPLFEECRKLQFSNKKSNKVPLGTTLRLPPIPNAAQNTLASTRGGFASPLSVEGSKCLFANTNQPLPRYSSAKPQHIKQLHDYNKLELTYEETRLFDLQQIYLSSAPAFSKLPPIPNAVKQSKRAMLRES